MHAYVVFVFKFLIYDLSLCGLFQELWRGQLPAPPWVWVRWYPGAPMWDNQETELCVCGYLSLRLHNHCVVALVYTDRCSLVSVRTLTILSCIVLICRTNGHTAKKPTGPAPKEDQEDELPLSIQETALHGVWPLSNLVTAVSSVCEEDRRFLWWLVKLIQT